MTAKADLCKIDPEQCALRFDKIDDKLEAIHNKLFVGNGHASLVTRLDRLEQSESGRKKLYGAVVGVVVVVLIEAVWNILVKLGGKP